MCKELIKNGATMVESAEEIAEIMGYKIKTYKDIPLTEEEKTILEIIESGIEQADEIIDKSPYSLEKTIETLASLEIKRVIAKDLDSYGII